MALAEIEEGGSYKGPRDCARHCTPSSKDPCGIPTQQHWKWTNRQAWKVRPALQTVEKTFRQGYPMGPRVSFNEGNVPNHTHFNLIRAYKKDKSEKYKMKCYTACCSLGLSIEVYLGAGTDKEKAKEITHKVVIRNITKSLRGSLENE
ncbi:Hypothetical protein PHPALM_14489 [Phytophthora palmivora]|uniref:PiggyBac transposable element-derived protein domain-containing protein n=1 Tax=Phytophthora palmivora TaxID=4796 RepID=A0A2P4XUJ2_9STRA|nr:Hypothetical protein PHPALM_14489 [Phytophthora palmivora]